MASVRVQLIIVAVVVSPLCGGPVDRRSSGGRGNPCPSYTSALPGAVNNWDMTFTATCPSGMAISRVQSVHCNTAEDRVWRFLCRRVPNLGDFTSHYWTPWVNEFDGVMNYACPSGRVITGFSSEHSNQHEDRRWKLRCSRKDGMTTSNHYEDLYANSWDGDMDYNVPTNFYIRGMYGYHDHGREDRLYGFDLCTVQV